MSRFIILRLDAPMMSFGGVMTDNIGRTDPVPGASMLTGLLGNALGYDHRDADALTRLQDRLVFGVRVDRPSVLFTDYQTVDLGQEHHVGTGWTTRGSPEEAEGSASTGTHIRTRDYHADARYTVAVTLKNAEEEPTIDSLKRVLMSPERPLFLGRKCCPPATPLLYQDEYLPDGEVEAESPESALRHVPGCGMEDVFVIRDDYEVGAIPVRDLRDWRNRAHTGRRFFVKVAS